MPHTFITFKDFKTASGKDRWKMIGKFFLRAGGIFLLFILGVFIYFAKDLPSPGKINSRVVAESTKIYDRTGNHLLYDIHGEEKRTQIAFSDMPDSVKFSTIALEDQNFYSNQGVEITSIVRAGMADLFHLGARQGGSTITQQLIKQAVLTPEKTLSRKIKEAILSIEMSQKFSKDEILGMYLNQIPYGSNAYGIESAAQTFFGKHANELTLDEATLLASLPQAPSYYSPYGNHTDALIGRQRYALKQMIALGYITQNQSDAAQQVDVLAKIKAPSENISAPHFVMFVKEYLEKKYGDDLLEQGGLKVYTTLDWDKQQAAEQAVRDGAATDLKYGANNSALVAMDPKTGQILAMVGSKDYFGKPSPDGCTPGKNCKFEGNFNVATALRQPGSSFKPYVYLTAFKKGYTPETNIWDVDTNFSTDTGTDYNPKNYDGKNHGLLQMKNALAMSLNVPAVKTLYLAGVKDSIDTAHALGITSLNDPDRYGLSLVLGGGEVTLLDHVSAYSAIATGGIHHDKTSILKITNPSGTVLEQYQDNPGQRVVDEKYVSMLDYIMSTNDLRAPVFGEHSPLAFTDRPVAAKTGTTNEWRDGWTIGFTPSLAVGVWSGNNDNTVMAQGADGVFTAAPIWRAFMNSVLPNYNIEQFPKYEKENTGKDVLDGKLSESSKIKVCKIPGKDTYCLANDACPESETDKKEFFTAHTILYYVNKDDPRGDAPKDPEKDPQYDNWEKAVKKWVDKNTDYTTKDVPTEQCKSSDFSQYKPSISISSPSDGDNIITPSFTISGSISAGYGVKSSALSVDGETVSAPTGNFSYDYAVPADKKTTNLEIQLTLTDNNGNDASSSITVHTNIP